MPAGRSSTISSSSRPARPRSRPALAESWDDLRRRARIYVPPAPRREVPVERALHADPRDERRRRALLARAAVEGGPPLPPRLAARSYDYFKDMGMPELLKSIEKVDDYTVRIRLTRPDAPFLADLAMPFNVIQSAEYADAAAAGGHAGEARHAADRHRAVRLRRLPAGRRGPLPRLRRLLGRTRSRSTRSSSRSRRTPAVRLTKLKAGECHVMAFPSPGDRAEDRGRPEPRASAAGRASTSAISR